MLQTIEGFWIEVHAGGRGAGLASTEHFAAPGLNIYANIALSYQDVLFNGFALPDSGRFFVASGAVAAIDSWTIYEDGGKQSKPIKPTVPSTAANAVGIRNCASITFNLFVVAGKAAAQINIFAF